MSVRTDVPCLYCIFDEQGHRVRACPGCITRMKLAPPMIVEATDEKRRELIALRTQVAALEGTVATLREALAFYGVHRPHCDRYYARPCTCGMSAALEANK